MIFSQIGLLELRAHQLSRVGLPLVPLSVGAICDSSPEMVLAIIACTACIWILADTCVADMTARVTRLNNLILKV